MIRLIETRSYRSLSHLRLPIDPFQILVGPNASGKSNLLDVLRLIGDALNDGIEKAVSQRAPNFLDLVWMRGNGSFELVVELDIPPTLRQLLKQDGFSTARYELELGLNPQHELTILTENLILVPQLRPIPRLKHFLDSSAVHRPETRLAAGMRKIVWKNADSGNDYFRSETTSWDSPFRLGPRRLALANLPEDEEQFPVAVWVKRTLKERINWVLLDGEAMRRPSAPNASTEFRPDGSNLPWVIQRLKESQPRSYSQWIDHVRTALPEVAGVETVEREEDRHRYLLLRYRNGLAAPSWTVSDGTLRLLALTIIPYLPDEGRVYLIEEPENGIHPRAVEAVFQSLSSAYGSQILCATHSPILVSLAEPRQILCFSRQEDGSTSIVTGDRHPILSKWKHESDLGTLFASGVLG